jgi:DNA polymerase III subunit delta
LKLPASQLSSHLERGLSGIYLIAADEPLLVGDAADAIRQAASERGFAEREIHFVERGFRWENLRAGADSLSLFADRRIIELRMATPRPGEAGARAIRSLAEEQEPDRLILISVQSRLDASTARSVWVRTVEQHGVVVEIRPVGLSDLPGFIARRARRHGLTLGADAAEALAERVEGNLLAADQELAKLALIHDDGRVDADTVLASVATSARFDVFRLSDAVVGGDLARAMTVLEGLKTEGIAPPLVLWALAREIMLLARLKSGATGGHGVEERMAQLRVWRSRQPAIRRALERYSRAELTGLVRRASAVDRAVKGLDRVPAWEAITGLVLELLASRSHRLPA